MHKWLIMDRIELDKKLLKSSATFCPIPFSTLIFNPDGTVGTCRELGTDHIVGDITKEDLKDIWNGPAIVKLRKEILSGNIKTCEHHQKAKSCNKLNETQALIEKLIDANPITQNKILRISPDFNGLCNLKCPMCNIWKLPNGRYDEIQFWPKLQNEIIPYLIEIDPLAGEPFVQNDLYRLMDIVIDKNPEVVWKFTTNGHWHLSEKIKSYLSKINIKFISISLDSVDPDNYKKVRTGHFDVVVKNIDNLLSFKNEQQKQGNSFELYINFTVYRDNWKEVPKIIEFANERKIKYFAQYLILPEELSLLTLTQDEKLEILQFYMKNLKDVEILSCHRILRALVNSCDYQIKSKYLNFFDVITGKKFSRLF